MTHIGPTHRLHLPKPLSIDTPQIRAAARLVDAVQAERSPDIETLRTLAKAFSELFGGREVRVLFGGTVPGLVPAPGRPGGYGLTTSDVVSAFVELERRKLVPKLKGKALAEAKRRAASAFFDVRGDFADSAEREIRRYWKKGCAAVKHLDDDDLAAVFAPYKIPDKKEQ